MRSAARAPTPIELGGTYAHSPSSEPPPPSREKDIQGYTPYLGGYWLPLAITKTPLFLVFSGRGGGGYSPLEIAIFGPKNKSRNIPATDLSPPPPPPQTKLVPHAYDGSYGVYVAKFKYF